MPRKWRATAVAGYACAMRVVWLALLVASCQGPSESRPVDLRRASPSEVVAALETTAQATRGFDVASSEPRLRAGHEGLAAYRRLTDPSVARAVRTLLEPMAADRSGRFSCEAANDLAELAHAEGDDPRALETIEGFLRDGTGSIGCREALRSLGRGLGLASEDDAVQGHAGEGTVHLGNVEVLGAERPEASAVRVVVHLDGEARTEAMPPQIVMGESIARLRIEGVVLGAYAGRSVGAGGLTAIRPAADGAGLDLVVEASASVRVHALPDPPRLLVDVARPASQRPTGSGLRLVVLDPGHGGDESGAEYEGVRESHLVLDIALRAAAALRRAMPATRVVLTRTTDDEVSLEQRSALANSLDADLFVSIHLNDADVEVITGGITSFVLDTTNERQAVRLAAREHATTTDRVAGLSVLLAGLHREGQVAESRRLASFVHGETLERARTVLPRLPDRGVRTANYYVLVGTRMPAMLVECSFMQRPEELTALRTVVYRQRLAEGIAAGIIRYARSR